MWHLISKVVYRQYKWFDQNIYEVSQLKKVAYNVNRTDNNGCQSYDFRIGSKKTVNIVSV